MARLTRDYLLDFAGVHGGGGNRTRVSFSRESPLLQEKLAAGSAAYQLSDSFVRSFEIDVYRLQDSLGRGAETNLYFLCEVEDGGAFKIGVASDPYERLRTLQIGSSREIALYAAAPATTGLESYVHRVLRRARIRGEWFRPTRRTLAVADLFRGVAEMLGTMEEQGEGPVDSADTLASITFQLDLALADLRRAAA